jgi:hypothetical protein
MLLLHASHKALREVMCRGGGSPHRVQPQCTSVWPRAQRHTTCLRSRASPGHDSDHARLTGAIDDHTAIVACPHGSPLCHGVALVQATVRAAADWLVLPLVAVGPLAADSSQGARTRSKGPSSVDRPRSRDAVGAVTGGPAPTA